MATRSDTQHPSAATIGGQLGSLWHPIRDSRLARLALLACALGLIVAGAIVAITSRGHEAAMDYVFYRDVGARWLTDGTFYAPRQLTGEPYDMIPMIDVLYPPSALVLFVPFVFLPAILWWVIPVGLLALVVTGYRPSPWAWVGIAFLAAWPRTFGAILFGNTDMWVAAFVAGGLRWGWPAAFLVIKPTFAPLGVVGIRRRSTWVVGVLLVVLSIPMLSDYITAMRNARFDGIAYAYVSLPFALIPIVAWLGRTRDPNRV